MNTIYLDGQYLKVNSKIIDAMTPGIFKAQGVFETMLGLDGFVLDANLHLQRLRRGLRVLGIRSPPIDPSVLTAVLKYNQIPLSRVRLMVWKSGKQIHQMALAVPHKILSKTIHRVCLVQTDRIANDRLADVKSLDYGLFAQAYAKAQTQGFDEALLINRQGFIFEASRANIFWMKDGVLHTPPLSSGCLNGITRQKVIKQARYFKLTFIEKNLTPAILRKADTVFLTNSLVGLKPILDRDYKFI